MRQRPPSATQPAPALGSSEPTWSGPPAVIPARDGGDGAWSGVNVIEFGSGAAGPISTRYFVEHGATVLRIESASRPDFLRVMALGPKNPHGLEGSPLYDVLNVGKRNATFNLKDPRAVELVKRLMLDWADVVVENFAPRAMKGFGLDYESLAPDNPGLVMVSVCLNGQTGPHKDYPGFGSQGSALAGFTDLTGWPDRAPVGPSGTITDSLAPRYVATAVAAGLHYARRTGRGVYLDVAQVEAGIYTLSPWLLEADADGVIVERAGNRSPRAVPHGGFACADETRADGSASTDRWVAIACWTDDEWATLAGIIGVDDPSLAKLDARLARIDEVETTVTAWTSSRTRIEVAEQLQAAGIEAVPVADFSDIHDDPQVEHRGHFRHLTHAAMGPREYELNGFRVDGFTAGYERGGPLLGEDNDWVQADILGLSDDERAALAEDGVFAERAVSTAAVSSPERSMVRSSVDRALVDVGVGVLGPARHLPVAEADEHHVVVLVPAVGVAHLVVAPHRADHQVGVDGLERLGDAVGHRSEAREQPVEHQRDVGAAAPRRHLRVVRRDVLGVVGEVREVAGGVARRDAREHRAHGLEVARPAPAVGIGIAHVTRTPAKRDRSWGSPTTTRRRVRGTSVPTAGRPCWTAWLSHTTRSPGAQRCT